MAEYIDRDELLNELCADCKGFSHKPCPNLTGRCAEYEFVRDFEAADVAPVRHGKWSWLGPDFLHNGRSWGTCSCCGVRSNLNEDNYCPNCGAKMDGGDDNDQ